MRLEDRIYTQSLADASGIMPPKSTRPRSSPSPATARADETISPPTTNGTCSSCARRPTATGDFEMNLRQIWTEVFQKPAGTTRSLPTDRRDLSRLHPCPPRTPAEAGQYAGRQTRHTDKAYSFKEKFRRRLAPGHAASPRVPETALARRHRQSRRLRFHKQSSPPGRRAAATPICPTVGCCVANSSTRSIPATSARPSSALSWRMSGTMDGSSFQRVPGHGAAQKAATRERIGSDRQWMLVFQDGRELPVSGSVLDYAPDPNNPDPWGETDGSAGLRGYMVKTDKFGEAKAMLAAMISAAAGAFPQTTNLISPLTGTTTQIQTRRLSGRLRRRDSSRRPALFQAAPRSARQEPFYVRVPAGTLFYLYVTQTVDLGKAAVGVSASLQPSSDPKQ